MCSHWRLLPGYCVVYVWSQTTVAELKSDGSLVKDTEYEDISKNKKVVMSYIYTVFDLYHRLIRVASVHLMNCIDEVAIIHTFWPFHV